MQSRLLLLLFPILLISCKNTSDAPANAGAASAASAEEAKKSAAIMGLLQKNTCQTCHKVSERLTGPPFMEIAAKGYTVDKIVELIYQPQPANWPGYPPMIGMKNVPPAEARQIAEWIVGLKK